MRTVTGLKLQVFALFIVVAGTPFLSTISNSAVTSDPTGTQLKTQCDAGTGHACGDLGWHYSKESTFKDTGKDDAEALRLYKKGCDLHDEYSCKMAGGMYAEGPVPKDFQTAKTYWEKACALNPNDKSFLNSCEGLRSMEATIAKASFNPQIQKIYVENCSKKTNKNACVCMLGKIESRMSQDQFLALSKSADRGYAVLKTIAQECP